MYKQLACRLTLHYHCNAAVAKVGNMNKTLSSRSHYQHRFEDPFDTMIRCSHGTSTHHEPGILHQPADLER